MNNDAQSGTGTDNVARVRSPKGEFANWIENKKFFDQSSSNIPAIYLSGPMSGKPEHNVRAFDAAMHSIVLFCHMNDWSVDVLNPAKHFGGRTDLPREQYMRKDIEQLLKADAVVFLDGWEDSVGATTEMRVATELGLPCFLLSTGERMRCKALSHSESARVAARPDRRPNTEKVEHIAETASRQFPTGSVRDTATGKGRPDLLPPRALLRVSKHYEKGAEKYGDRNWELGQPLFQSFIQSAHRHLLQIMAGRTDEDHAAAVAFNILGFIETQERIREGMLPESLDDTPAPRD